jgi:hypothetical protein
MRLKDVYRFLRHPVRAVVLNSKFYKSLYENNCGLSKRNLELSSQNEYLEEAVYSVSETLKDYKQEVLKTSEYQKLFQENQDLTKRNKNLEGLCGLQKKVINKTKQVCKDNLKLHLKELEEAYISRAKTDSKLSYLIIGGHGRIIIATNEFLKKFNFGEDIVGKNYSLVLKNPEREIYCRDLRKIFKDANELKFDTVICDGKGSEKSIFFVKHEPEIINFIRINELGIEEKKPAYFYTKVEIHELGIFKKVRGEFVRIFKHGRPKTPQEFIEQQYIHQIVSKQRIAGKMIKKAKNHDQVLEINRLWSESNSAEEFKQKCDEFYSKE